MNIKMADRLVTLRKAHGYSQEALAAKLGLSRQAISKWERAEASPDTDNLMALAALYGTTLDALINTETDLIELTETEEVPEPEQPKPPKTALQIKGIKLLKFPFPLFVIAAFLLIGFQTHTWHPTWLLFLLLPIYYHFAAALTVRKTKARLLAMPVPEVVAFVYLLCGFFGSMWKSTLLLLFIIPLYYWLVACFYKDKPAKEEENRED